MPHHITLSSWELDLDRDPLRLPTRPEVLRHADFEDHFDFTTVFADLFWDASGTRLVATGPPLLNLADELQLEFVVLPSGDVAPFDVQQHLWMDRFEIEVPARTTGLSIEWSLGTRFVAPQPNLCHLFEGKRAIFTLNKNNHLAWIHDWARFHHEEHGCDAVLIYDNGSDAYSLAELERAACAAGDDLQVVVVGWPFTYGVFDGRQAITHNLWDSFYCQAVAFEHARHRFLSTARSVLNVDVDELALTKGPDSVFELAERSETGYLRFDGHWVYPEDVGDQDEPGRIPRHADAYLKSVGVLDRSTCKWAVVPSRCERDAQWQVHEIWGMSPDVCSRRAVLRHFKHLNTDWDVDGHLSTRKRSAATRPDDVIVDEPLKQALETSVGDPRRDPIAHLADCDAQRSPQAAAYAQRVKSGRRAASGQIDEALVASASAIRGLQQHPGVRLHRAQLLARAGDSAEASRLIEAVAQERRSNALWCRQEARARAANGETEQAIELFDETLSLDPTDSSARRIYFDYLTDIGRGDAALTLARDSISLPGDDAERELLLARLHARTGRLSSAVMHVRQALALDPTTYLYHLLARLYAASGDLTGAERAQRAAIGLRKAEVRQGTSVVDRGRWNHELTAGHIPTQLLHAALAEILLKRNELGRAEAEASHAVVLEPLSGKFTLLLAEITERRGNAREGDRLRQRAVRLAVSSVRRQLPDSGADARLRTTAGQAVFRQAASVLQQAGRAELSVALLREACSLWPDHPFPRLELGRLFLELGNATQALHEIDEALTNGSGSWHSELERLKGEALLRLGDTAGATDAFAREASLLPDHAGLWHRLGALLADLGRWEEAVEAQRAVLELDGRHAGALHRLDVALSKLGRSVEALRAARRAAELSPENAGLRHRLGVLLEGVGRWEEAAEAHSAVLAFDQHHAGARQHLSIALGELSKERGEQSPSTAKPLSTGVSA